ncbi:MAG: hypothetical protein KC933_41515, partial [Myxococcales bacterium]|nr:hypothetical protein [Myxococcales bacterium]
MAHYSKRGKRWWVRWREGGRGGTCHSLTVGSEREAKRLVADIEASIDRIGRYEPRRAGRATPLEVILADYVADCARRLAPATVRRYSQHLELFRRWVGPALADRLSFELLSDYHVHLCSPESGRHLHRRGPETVRKHLEALEVLWAWAWKRQARGTYHGVPQPDSLELRRTPPPHQEAPTWVQMDAAIDAAKGWQRDLYVVLRCTGLRVQQAMGLRWEDIDLEAKLL